MLNCLTLVPSVTDISLGDVFVTVNGHSNLFDYSMLPWN